VVKQRPSVVCMSTWIRKRRMAVVQAGRPSDMDYRMYAEEAYQYVSANAAGEGAPPS
jgi:hypothetical protein